MSRHHKKTTIRGDFQTPPELAARICDCLAARGQAPAAVLEPTCGAGAFLVAAARAFPTVRQVVGLDIDGPHLAQARRQLERAVRARRVRLGVRLIEADAFRFDWPALTESLPEPLLVLGNPPWVTSAAQGRVGGDNLPTKRNVDGDRGIDAMTGRGNFDVSEWLLRRGIEWVEGRRASLAMLCKTSVARKALLFAWKQDLRVARAEIRHIDAESTFGVTVNACLLVVDGGRSAGEPVCAVFPHLDAESASAVLGFQRDRLLADVRAFRRWRHLSANGQPPHRWRSGVKHDCARVMELRASTDGTLRNGLGEPCDLEPDFLFPMLKSADLMRGRHRRPRRWMLVPQRRVGQPTDTIRSLAPATWRYLVEHKDRLDRRASTIYRNQPRFAVFGVGDYTFARWKVAVAGLAKELVFRVVGPFEGKPVVLDDTCYQLACRSRAEACHLADLLDSKAAREFFQAFVFWDAKRPITATLLNGLDLETLDRDLGPA